MTTLDERYAEMLRLVPDVGDLFELDDAPREEWIIAAAEARGWSVPGVALDLATPLATLKALYE